MDVISGGAAAVAAVAVLARTDFIVGNGQPTAVAFSMIAVSVGGAAAIVDTEVAVFSWTGVGTRTRAALVGSGRSWASQAGASIIIPMTAANSTTIANMVNHPVLFLALLA